MIVTFGSINVDFIFSVADLPQPGQTLLANGFRTCAGGKGANQALAAARDGSDVVMVGAVGNDALAAIGLQNLKADTDISRVSRVPEQTGCASICIDSRGRNNIVVAAGSNLAASSEKVEDALLEQVSVVLMQMENDVAEVENLIRRASAAKAISILNLAPAFPLQQDVLSLCDLIVVNEDEAAALAGWLGCDGSAQALAKCLNTGVLRTLGADGAEAFANGAYILVPAMRVEVRDTSAAGDCFIGVLASALDRGLPLKAAMTRATIAAGIACSRAGSQDSIPLRAETDLAVADL